jgi:hypothetical protein
MPIGGMIIFGRISMLIRSDAHRWLEIFVSLGRIGLLFGLLLPRIMSLARIVGKFCAGGTEYEQGRGYCIFVGSRHLH